MTKNTAQDLTFDQLIDGLGGSSGKDSAQDSGDDGDESSETEKAGEATPAEEALRNDRARRQAAPTVPVRPRNREGSTVET